MTSNEPGDRPGGRRLAEAPSARYASGSEEGPADAGGSALAGPLMRGIVVAMLGAAALVLVGAVLASTFGLLFAAGAMGAAIGLVLARAAVPGTSARPVARTVVTRYAIVLAVVAVAVGDVGTWLYGRTEGGTLGLFDYLWTTFGPFVPGVAIVAAIGAAWGASAGPVQR